MFKRTQRGETRAKPEKQKTFHVPYNVVIYMGWVWEFVALVNLSSSLVFSHYKRWGGGGTSYANSRSLRFHLRAHF